MEELQQKLILWSLAWKEWDSGSVCSMEGKPWGKTRGPYPHYPCPIFSSLLPLLFFPLFFFSGTPRQKLTRQIWGIWKLRLAYSPETPNLGQNRWCFVPCDLEIWRMTLENDRASLLCCFKLCATFHSHWWIQTGVTVRKRQIWVKFDDFLEPCDLEIWRMTLNKANLRDLKAATGL